MDATGYTKEERLKRAIASLEKVKGNAKAVFDEMEFLKSIGVTEEETWQAHDAVFKKPV